MANEPGIGKGAKDSSGDPRTPSAIPQQQNDHETPAPKEGAERKQAGLRIVESAAPATKGTKEESSRPKQEHVGNRFLTGLSISPAMLRPFGEAFCSTAHTSGLLRGPLGTHKCAHC